jgi:hypothetical protein
VGTYRRLAASGDIFAYIRATESETLAVAVNFGRGPGFVRLGSHPAGTAWRRLLGTHDGMADGVAAHTRFELEPYEAVVLGPA